MVGCVVVLAAAIVDRSVALAGFGHPPSPMKATHSVLEADLDPFAVSLGRGVLVATETERSLWR